MKATAHPICQQEAALEARSWLSIWSELIKARLTFLVLLTTLVGFYMGSGASLDWVLMAHTLVATALVASGASALNQYLERDYDARMRRTENRPLPSGAMQPLTALSFGVVTSCVGLGYLSLAVNLLTALLGAVCLVLYVFLYTPLKRVTTLNTVIGAIPGALPPLMGWTAATGRIDVAGWALFAVLFFWQLPHFLSIAWIYRDDYAKAGYKMLPLYDPTGQRTASQAVSHTLGLLPISLFPSLFGLTGWIYFSGALILGVLFFALAVVFARSLSLQAARRLFLVSILYLPLLLGLMVFDKVPFLS